MVRLSLLWLLAGFIVGGAMLVDRDLPGAWRLWAQPTHGHMLFVGWFLQFALGIAYWLLPRKRSPERPVGYDLRLAKGAVAALNVGLLCRVVAEPLERSGHSGKGTLALLALSAALQIGATVVFVLQIWPRVAARPPRSQAS
jgi:hypothetical protein